jgi:Family of unknown function (DUF6002)
VSASQKALHTTRAESVLVRYYTTLKAAARMYEAEAGWPALPPGFRPSPVPPVLSEPLIRFFEPARMSMVSLPAYRGLSLHLLNLMLNPSTRTTKTFPSLLITARAVAHIRNTGERIMIVTPTSGNKGTALRDAVLRALQLGLVRPSELSVAMIAPPTALPKLWSSALSADPELRRRNPVMIHAGPAPDSVKSLASEFVRTSAGLFANKWGLRLWFTLDLANYVVADAARACFEADVLPAETGQKRIHAHAVSSAFGLLGYHLGRRVLMGEPDPGHPQFLLVQHLRTPDMVLSLRQATSSPATRPAFARSPAGAGYAQSADPGFPFVTDEPDEELDSTFYTRRPATSAMINDIIRRHGGGGIVISRRECQERYDELRGWLAEAGIGLPPDSGKLREWSLVMALTGVLNAIDRGLLRPGSHVVLHASGSYSEDDYEQLPMSRTSAVNSLADVNHAIAQAASP